MLFDRETGDLDPQPKRRPLDSGKPQPEAVCEQLERTLSSKTFVNSPQLCRFLRFLVEQEIAGRSGDLKEYVLAVEVFRKDPSFDPRVDTVVRTEARRLRQKLAEYYHSEGRTDPIEIVLPKGGYRAVFQPRVEEATPAPLPGAPSAPRIPWAWIAGAVSLALASAAIYWLTTPAHRGGPARAPSIAVLPLENLTGDAQQEYFSDGMTDALLTDLAKLHALSVISRTSVMRYKKTKKQVAEIARELKVDYILEGTVTRAGDRVRITAQLIAAPTDHHIWAESYDRSGRDVLSLEAEIARAIAHQVSIRITPQEQARLGTRIVSVEARDLYLKGRFHWMTRTTGGLQQSVEYFKQAIAREPRYALAYAGLSDSYFAIENRTDREDLLALGCEAARNAVALDDNLGEAHAALANCADDWAWPERERELKRALELSPGYATAHHWYGGVLINTGRFEEGLAEMRRAAELDPLSPISNVALGSALYITRQYDQSIAQIQLILETFPEFVPAYLHLGLAYSAKGMQAEAVATLEKALQFTNGAPPVATLLAHAHVRAGDTGPAKRLISDFKKREGITPILLGLLYMDTGDKDRAFEWFDKAVEQRSQFADELKVEPMYEQLHSDPRWAVLLRKMNLSN